MTSKTLFREPFTYIYTIIYLQSKMKKLLYSIAVLLFVSCEVAPKKINYGDDHCYHCDMTVVDKTHAAQYVTKKGRQYAFDAVECLVMKLDKEKNEDAMAFILVADYANPGNLVDAKTAIYLISEKIKSPMGANLSAFSSKEVAQKKQQEFGGKLYSWKTLKEKFAH